MSTPAIRTTCPYCGVGCGVIATQQPGGGWTVQGDPDHPANFGRLCSKGTALAETIALDGRLLAPRIAGQDTGWPEALDLVANRFSAAIAEFGPDSVENPMFLKTCGGLNRKTESNREFQFLF